MLAMGSRSSLEVMHAVLPSPTEKIIHSVETKEHSFVTAKQLERVEAIDVPKEQTTTTTTTTTSTTTSTATATATATTTPVLSPPQNRVKKQSTSTRSSLELFRSRKSADDDVDGRSSKQQQQSNSNSNSGSGSGSFSVSDGIGSGLQSPTITSHDERRLSDKMRKAWRGVTGQKHWDPLELWMVKHSGGTLREVPAQQQLREHPNGHWA